MSDTPTPASVCPTCGRPRGGLEDIRNYGGGGMDGKCFARYAYRDPDAAEDCERAAMASLPPAPAATSEPGLEVPGEPGVITIQGHRIWIHSVGEGNAWYITDSPNPYAPNFFCKDGSWRVYFNNSEGKFFSREAAIECIRQWSEIPLVPASALAAKDEEIKEINAASSAALQAVTASAVNAFAIKDAEIARLREDLDIARACKPDEFTHVVSSERAAHSTIGELRKEITSLKAELVEANKDQEIAGLLQTALSHVTELEDAWRRGAINECDGQGGTRSNRNTEVRVLLAAIAQHTKGPQ